MKVICGRGPCWPVIPQDIKAQKNVGLGTFTIRNNPRDSFLGEYLCFPIEEWEATVIVHDAAGHIFDVALSMRGRPTTAYSLTRGLTIRRGTSTTVAILTGVTKMALEAPVWPPILTVPSVARMPSVSIRFGQQVLVFTTALEGTFVKASSVCFVFNTRYALHLYYR